MKTKFLSLIIASVIIGATFSLPTPGGRCSDEQFSCGEAEGNCIPIEWVCDNIKDCLHGKDEANCNYLHECFDDDYMCKTGECISAKFKCDGRHDCSDGSDEAACVAKIQPESPESTNSPIAYETNRRVTCELFEFLCEKSNKCISKNKVCNGMADCEYMEDEADCEVGCPLGGFPCKDGSGCYMKKCDGYKECNDGSDEVGCAYDDLPSMDAFFNDHYHGCGNDEFKCSNNECIPKSKLCDGYSDCAHGEDENGLCGQCTSYDCAYKCLDSPKGAECFCPEGQYLSADFKTCEVANMCFDNDEDECNHFCRPKGATTACYCADGYHLNGTTQCQVDEMHMNGELFVSVGGNSLRRLPLFNITGTYYEEVASNPQWKIASISLDPRGDSVYFVAREDHHVSYIYEVNRSGGDAKKLLNAHDLKDIAVDWTTGNIFYTAEGQYPGVGVCTKDGRFCKQLVDGEYKERGVFTQRYGGLLVHPQRGMLAYVSYNAEHPLGVVRLVGMDGLNDRILSNQVNHPKVNSIALDYVRDNLFVSEEHSTVRYDLHTLKTGTLEVPVLAKSAAIFNGQFYFVGRDSKLRIAKFNDAQHDVLHVLGAEDAALAINNSIYFPNVSNPCEAANCTHICVVTEKRTAKCLCPDQYGLNDVTAQCEPIVNHSSRVKLSASEMVSRCAEGNACVNNGFCDPDSYDDAKMLSPSCSCPKGYSGLYCEVAISLIEEDSSTSSSGWKTFFWTLFFLIAALLVAFYLATTFCPEYTRFITDRIQYRFASMRPQMRGINAKFDNRARVVPLTREADNVQSSSLATPTKSSSANDLSKSSFLNPFFSSTSELAQSSTENYQEPTLHKSPSADFKLNIEE